MSAIRCAVVFTARSVPGRSEAALRNTEQIRARVAELGDWFHNMDLKGVRTAPDHFLGNYPYVKWRKFADAIPASER